MSRTSGTLTSNFNDLITPKREDFYSEMQAFIDGALNAALNNVVSGDNQQITIDGHGLWARKWVDNAFGAKQIKIQDDGIYFTKDKWKNCAMAIGTINIGGNEHYGVVGEALIGNILIGANLTISNGADAEQSTFYVDSDGAKMLNCSFKSYSASTESTSLTKLEIDPSDANYVMALYGRDSTSDAWGTPKLYADRSGNVQLDGQLTAIADWTNSATSLYKTVTGGFARLSGTVTQAIGSLASGTAVAFSAGTLNGTTETPKFAVNYAGKMVAQDAELLGTFKMEGSTMNLRDGTSPSFVTTWMQNGLIGFTTSATAAWADYYGYIGYTNNTLAIRLNATDSGHIGVIVGSTEKITVSSSGTTLSGAVTMGGATINGALVLANL